MRARDFLSPKVLNEGDYSHIWYHGSGMDFDKFDTDAKRLNRGGNPSGVYLTKDEDVAREYAERQQDGIVYEVEVDVFNPYYPGRSEVKPEMLDAYREQLKTFPGYSEQHIESMVRDFAESGNMKNDLYGKIKTIVIQAGGYDSTFFADFGFNSLVVFDSNDITILNKFKPQQFVKDPEYDQHLPSPKKDSPKAKPVVPDDDIDDDDLLGQMGREFM